MGTEYALYKDENLVKLSISEMSNKLQFQAEFDTDKAFALIVSEEMSPEEMAKVFLKGLTVCAYWMDANELMILIEKHMNEAIY